MKKPVVLILENSVDVTGALKSITRTAYDLREDFDFLFVTPEKSKGRFWIEGKGFSKIYELRLKEINKSITGLLMYIPFLLWNSIKLKHIIKKENVSVVHVNDIYNLLPVVLNFFGYRVSYVCHIRFLPDRFPPWLFNFWLNAHLRYAKKIIVVSKSVLNMLKGNPKFELIYNELPVEEQYPEKMQNPRNPGEFVFLYLSNFIKGKGQDFALEAFGKIHAELPHWRLRFVGGDMGLLKNKEYKIKLQKRAQELNILEKTEWHEFTEEVEKEYKQADIVLNFSESESFSITSVETLFFGKPLIVTDCGGPKEIVDHNVTGLIVPNRDVPEMIRAMKRLAINKNERERFAQKGRIDVRMKFSVERTSTKLKKIYEDSIV